MAERSQTRRARCACAAALVAGALLGITGCFRYVPVQPGAVRPDEEVQVRLTEDAAVRLVRELGTFREQLEGQLAPHGPDSLSLSILVGSEYRGTAFENVRQTTSLGLSEVVEIRRRQLSRRRTAFATAGALAIFGILIHSIVQQENPNPSDDGQPPPPPPDPNFIRIPIPWSR